MMFGNKMRRPRRRDITTRPESGPQGLGRSCTLVDLVEASCRWPIGEATPYMFCNNQSLDSVPYCAGHARLAYK
jgi:GcrA cell cycle regulator